MHIIANSDSFEDQKLKLMIRDEILNYSKTLYKNCNSIDDSIEITKKNINNFIKIARNVENKLGYNYDINVQVMKEYFDIRYYEDFTLPAGIYDCVKIIIGKGTGHNWWCVMYPSVCLSGCTKEFDKILNNKEKKFITSKKYIPKMKVLEATKIIKHKITT